ncbi:MAG: hypothetical protein HDT41_06275 [Lachnospiraceae bacterium]|nr:hypothetical protein [Lachnospiraceae bacterium]
MKKKYGFIIVLAVIILMGSSFFKIAEKIEFDKEFNKEVFHTKEYYVKDEKSARKIIRAQGKLMRNGYSDSEIIKVEKYLEDAYKIEAVNLQGIDPETADSIKVACDYMFREYPFLTGFITNITVSNEISDNRDILAKYENFIYITNPNAEQLYPFVIKKQILLNEAEFCNKERMNNLIIRNIKSGFWPEGTSVTSIFIHELTHALIDNLICNKYGLNNHIYITEKNAEAFSNQVSENLSYNQNYAKELCESAYENYVKIYDSHCSYQDFCFSISEYGYGSQEDGGISYEETIAEAMAEYYIDAEDSSLAGKMIISQIEEEIIKLGIR